MYLCSLFLRSVYTGLSCVMLGVMGFLSLQHHPCESLKGNSCSSLPLLFYVHQHTEPSQWVCITSRLLPLIGTSFCHRSCYLAADACSGRDILAPVVQSSFHPPLPPSHHRTVLYHSLPGPNSHRTLHLVPILPFVAEF